MKADMITLIEQLKESEERCTELSRPNKALHAALEKKLHDAEKSVLATCLHRTNTMLISY